MSVLDQLNTYLTTAGFAPKTEEATAASKVHPAKQLQTMQQHLQELQEKAKNAATPTRQNTILVKIAALKTKIKDVKLKLSKDSAAAKKPAGKTVLNRDTGKRVAKPGNGPKKPAKPAGKVSPYKAAATRELTKQRRGDEKPAAKKPAAKAAAPAKAAGGKRLDAMKAQYKQLGEQITKLQTQRKALRAKMESAGAKFKGRKAA